MSVLSVGLEYLRGEYRPPKSVLYPWIDATETTRTRGEVMFRRCVALEKMFSEDGFDCCILKGQGNALLYPNPLTRQSGDIDIWVRPKSGWSIKETVKYLSRKCGKENLHVVYHHTVFPVWDDVVVEVHWRPSWRSSPFFNRRMQRWFLEEADKQFHHYNKESGFHSPTWEFNAVYLLQHMYLHVLQEGLGVRQFVDYYYLLKSERRREISKVVKDIKYLGLYDFACAVMYVLKKVFAIGDEFMIVPIDKKRGSFLLEEVHLAGNFGYFDKRNDKLHRQTGIRRSFSQLMRKGRFVRDYPEESLSGIFQIYHVIWRVLRLWQME